MGTGEVPLEVPCVVVVSGKGEPVSLAGRGGILELTTTPWAPSATVLSLESIMEELDGRGVVGFGGFLFLPSTPAPPVGTRSP